MRRYCSFVAENARAVATDTEGTMTSQPWSFEEDLLLKEWLSRGEEEVTSDVSAEGCV